MTYNNHVGVGMDKKLDLQRIADVINREHPDLVGLQEVDRGVKRTEGKDEIVELAKMTRMDYAFAHNLDYQGGQYGVALDSEWREVGWLQLPGRQTVPESRLHLLADERQRACKESLGGQNAGFRSPSGDG